MCNPGYVVPLLEHFTFDFLVNLVCFILLQNEYMRDLATVIMTSSSLIYDQDSWLKQRKSTNPAGGCWRVAWSIAKDCGELILWRLIDCWSRFEDVTSEVWKSASAFLRPFLTFCKLHKRQIGQQVSSVLILMLMFQREPTYYSVWLLMYHFVHIHFFSY